MTQEVLEIIKDEFVSDRTRSKPRYEHFGMINVNVNAIYKYTYNGGKL